MSSVRFILVFLIGFAIYYWIDANYFSSIQKAITFRTGSRAAAHILTYSITLLPLLLTLVVLHKSYRTLPEKLGLHKSFVTGITFGFLTTLPMLVGYGIRFNLNKDLAADTLIINTISSAFFEEIIYRAFLFGQLYRYTRLGFLPSVFLGSLLFGLAHLYQSSDLMDLVGIFTITFIGSVLFSWIYAEWKFNLWTAIFLHCLMNLYWLIFDVDENALGSTYANIFRFSTVFLAIVGTIFFKYKKKIPFEIRGKWWWLKPASSS